MLKFPTIWRIPKKMATQRKTTTVYVPLVRNVLTFFVFKIYLFYSMVGNSENKNRFQFKQQVQMSRTFEIVSRLTRTQLLDK